MAFPSVTTASPANIFPAGFQAVFIKDTSSSLWQTLGAISNGVLNIKDFSTPDSLGRNKAQGASDFTAKCNMLQASLIELELLDSICDGTNDFLFKLADAAAIPTGGSAATIGWITVTASRVGVKAKVVADGDPSNDMHIELEWQGSILLSEKDATVKAAIDDNEFCSTAGSSAKFYGIGTYTAALNGGLPANSHIKPCGVSTLTLADNAGGSPVTMSPITNVKMSYEMLAVTDSLRRFLPKSMDINLEWDWLASDAADLLLLDAAMVQLDVNLVITMLNGVIFTLTNQTGIETNFEITGDMDAARVVRFTHKGKVLQSSFDGIVST